MSRIDVARRFFEAYNARDLDAWAEICSPEFEFKSVFVRLEGGSYTGPDGIRRYFADLDESFERFRLEDPQLHTAGDRVYAEYRVRGAGRASGAGFEAPHAAIFEFDEEDRVVSLRSYPDVEQARRDAGRAG